MNNKNETSATSPASGPSCSSSEDTPLSKSKQKSRSRKRRRRSSSTDNEMILPDNTLETERNVCASAIKNNLDDTSVRKILKKVVTNDHVLALVHLQEEEEGDSESEDKSCQPKLTRAKAKELKKVSPRSKAWNLGNLELTPIEHIPVKTRPEVKALIAQELPDDEDDDEYEPTHEDVLSEDEHEQSCSDLDSQPRTPAPPPPSPNLRDGPFKVPQEISTPHRKLIIDEEEATIALRTRSKLSLSTTTIEHLESSFVPPDEVAAPVDDLWSQFLSDCLQPAPTHDDDDDDPEYNAAADPDALEEDEDILASSLIKISKKELNDLVTELFNVMPATVTEVDEDLTLENLANSVLTDTSRLNNTSRTDIETPRFEGKSEPLSDDENQMPPSKRLKFEKGNNITFSPGKKEIEDTPTPTNHVPCRIVEQPRVNVAKKTPRKYSAIKPKPDPKPAESPKPLQICIEECNTSDGDIQSVPPALRSQMDVRNETVRIEVDAASGNVITREQVLILQQQLRMHIQLATSNFLQLYVHPVHWKLGPTYKDYLETLEKLNEANENSVVNVCNLKPALELVRQWEEDVSKDTPENVEMVEFINEQMERTRRRYAQHSTYLGDFHDKLLKLIAGSPVFLYPYLLPATPYRAEHVRRVLYLRSEDSLIVLGLEQFWKYIEDNDDIFKCVTKRSNSRHRKGLNLALQLVNKHMLPWMTPKQLAAHVVNMRGLRNYKDKNNPIYNYFENNEVTPVQHSILPFNPDLTLYEQPEHEMPRLWVRYLAKTSKRFKQFYYGRNRAATNMPTGVPISTVTPETTVKRPLPHDFTKTIKCTRNPEDPMTSNEETTSTSNPPTSTSNPPTSEPADPNKKPEETPLNMFKLVTTTTGSFLVPLEIVTVPKTSTTNTVTNSKPAGTEVNMTTVREPMRTKSVLRFNTAEHCSCCFLLRRIAKRQSLITDFFNTAVKKEDSKKRCYCGNVKHPTVTNKLRLLANNFKNHSGLVYCELERRLDEVKDGKVRDDADRMGKYTLEELVSVTTFQLKIVSRSLMSKYSYIKVRCKNLLTMFNPDTGDPLHLAHSLFKTCEKEMLDLYYDFLEFLTPEQADKLNNFSVYFSRNCAKGLMDKVEDQVKDMKARARILSQLKRVFSDNKSTACEICSYLLDSMEGYDTLAEYTFSLFPHRSEARIIVPPATTDGNPPEPTPVAHISISQAIANLAEECDTDYDTDESEETTEKNEGIEENKETERNDSENENSEDNQDAETQIEESVMDEECDSESSSGEGIANTNDTATLTPPAEQTEKPEESREPDNSDPPEQPSHSEETPAKIKVELDSMYTEDNQIEHESFIVTLEEVKEELDESWTREDDKLILEVIKQLTPEERKDRTIAEVLEERQVLKMIAEKIRNKSEDEVRERMMYILSVLVVSES